MSHKRKGQLADSNEWGKHLHPFARRFYWQQERLAEKFEIKTQLQILCHAEKLRPDFSVSDQPGSAQQINDGILKSTTPCSSHFLLNKKNI